jgi:hydrogenase nickel incorporation protein HypA/HybF
MHEMSIAQNILEIVQEEMNRNQYEPGRVREVAVQVGELVAVVPASLEFCFNILIENTEWKGAKLNIEVLPLIGRCQDCRHEYHIQDYDFICPQCNSTKITVVQGQELLIRHLEVE